MSRPRSAVLELRQYTLVPGKRDVLIDLFEEHFIEGQEATGIELIGTFRDAGDDTRFVWLRGFPDMETRAKSLSDFYYGTIWQAHRETANATMVDSDNVLLLRAVRDDLALAPAGGRPPVDAPAREGAGTVEAGILGFDQPGGDQLVAAFERDVAPLIAEAGGRLLALLATDESENTFPALPVREGEHVLVWLAGFPDGEQDGSARAAVLQAASELPGLRGAPDVLRLLPTRRSALVGGTSG